MVDYDTIVVGSGVGGLAAAVSLAQSGQRILVCEQHEVPGGWSHSFTREGYRFNTGVHYVGELGPGERLREIYEGLGITNDLAFLEINPDGIDHLFLGDTQFDIPKGEEVYLARLKERFPHEADNLDRLFAKTTDIFWVLNKMLDEEWLSIFRRPTALPWFARSGGALVNHFIQAPLLRAILTAQSGTHGLPPSLVSSAIHTGIMRHYLEGAYHPLGGGQAIARAFVRALKRAGGKLRLQTTVQRILLQGRRAVGVELDNGERVYAKHIVSNADPRITFHSLIGQEHLSRRLRLKLARTSYSTSCLTLFLAVDCDLQVMGLDSGNYWLYMHRDIEKVYRLGLTEHAAHHTPPVLFVTSTTLKDPGKMQQGHHQLEVFAFVSYDAFERWEQQPPGDRDGEYQELKQQISERMLAVLDSRFNGIRERVVFQELGTPLTNSHYVNVHRGNIYGVDKGVWQAGPLAFRPDTEFEGLYLCGASTMAHGIAYATLSGLTAAGRILGCPARSLLRQNGPELQIFPCDDVSQWPEQIRRRVKRKMNQTSG